MNANSVVTVLPSTKPPARLRRTNALGIEGRLCAGKNRRTQLRRLIARRDDVLDADADPRERTRLGTCAPTHVERTRNSQRVLAVEMRPCLHIGIGGGDAVQERARERLAALHARAQGRKCSHECGRQRGLDHGSRRAMTIGSVRTRAASPAGGRNSPCRSLRNRRPRSVGRMLQMIAFDQPALLRRLEALLDQRQRKAGALGKQRNRNAPGKSQRIEHELEAHVVTRNFVALEQGLTTHAHCPCIAAVACNELAG